MKTILFSSALLVCSCLNAQTIDLNNTSCDVLSNGFLSNYQVPKNSTISALYSIGLCMGGVDANSQLKAAVGSYSSQGADYSPGPYSSTTSYADASYQNAYSSSIWEVSLAEIQNHVANYNQVGYVAPLGISSWPGNGVAGIGVAQNLAPFIDLNSNGLYEPTLGDYPEIRGDFAAYVIMNDVAALGMSEPIGVEIHAMIYQFETNDYLNNTTFVNYKVINRSSQTLSNFKVGLFADFELGNSTDDYIGCDTTSNLVYAYNADNMDENSGPSNGYLSNPPSVGIKCLSHDIDNVVVMSNGASFPYGDPSTPVQFYNLMNGKWNDGSNRYFGGNGTNSTTSTPTSFMFSGNPDGSSGWSEVSASNQPSDKRALMSSDIDVLVPFSVHCFDYAILYAREPDNNNIQNAQALINLAATAQSDFDAMTNYNCNLFTASIDELDEAEIGLFPNPSSGKFALSFGNETLSGTITMLDLQGKVVQVQEFGQTNNLELGVNVNPGIYHLMIQTNKGLVNKKLVIAN